MDVYKLCRVGELVAVQAWYIHSVVPNPPTVPFLILPFPLIKPGVSRDDTLVIHLRFAGAVEGWFADPTYHELPLRFYTDVVTRHGKCARAILVHDPKSKESALDIASALEAKFPGIEIIKQCASRCEDFMVMYKAKHLALSVSTFAWWAGFLGVKSKSTVFYPRHAKVAWWNPRRLKTWYNHLMPEDAVFVPVEYTTAPTRSGEAAVVKEQMDHLDQLAAVN
eukprot:1392412-Amorphochlora_amoeboformis.AAC.1